MVFSKEESKNGTGKLVKDSNRSKPYVQIQAKTLSESILCI